MLTGNKISCDVITLFRSLILPVLNATNMLLVNVRFSLEADLTFPPAFCLELFCAVSRLPFHTINQSRSGFAFFRICSLKDSECM